MNQKKSILSLSCFLVFISLQVAAPKAQGDGGLSLDEIVVTATRTPTPKSETPSVMDVVSNREILEAGARDLTEVLKTNTSIDVIQYPGTLSGISIRGFRPEFSGITKHSLLLIDGRPAGATNLSTILLGNIEMIEVLKGPASSLYGAEAMGGVVNVITKRSTGKLTGRVSLQAGSFNTYNGRAWVGGRLLPRLDFDFTASSLNQNSDMELGNGHGKRPGTTYNIGYGSLRLGGDIADGWRIETHGDWYYGNDIETPGALYYLDRQQGQKDIERYGGDVRIQGIWGRNKSLFVLYGSREGSDYMKKYDYDPTSGGYAPTHPYRSYCNQTTWWGIQAQNLYRLFDSHSITAGIDYQKINVNSKSYNKDGSRRAPWSPDNERDNWAVFTETMWRFMDENLILTAGLRYDYFDVETKKTPYKTDFIPGSESFDTVSPRAGVRYNWNKMVGLHTTIGKAFVPPKADQMAGYSERMVGNVTMVTRGNPDLDPETSWTWDLGLSFSHDRSGAFMDLTYFMTEVDDMITRTTKGNTTTFRNSSSAEMGGLEITLKWDAGMSFNLAKKIEFFLDGTRLFYAREKKSGRWTDIHNVAHWKFNYGVAYDDGLVNGRITARYMGKRKDYDWYAPGYPEIEYDSFTVVDTYLGVKFKKHHSVNLKISNIFDKYYYEKPEFPLAGRAWYLEYRFQF